jgi:hypothetical protein
MRPEWRKKKAASTRVDAAWVDPMSRVIPVTACSWCCVAEPESLDPRFRGDDALAKAIARRAIAPLRHFTLTSCTSKTTAWFGPIGDCGVLP